MEETTVLGQICQLLGVKRLAEWGEASGVNRYSKGLTVERLLFVLVAAQLRGVASLRDAAQLCAEDEALRDTIGLRDLGRSTLSDALAVSPRSSSSASSGRRRRPSRAVCAVTGAKSSWTC